MSRFLYDSRNPRCKTPFGAVGCGETVTITFPVHRDVGARQVRLYLRALHGTYKLDYTLTPLAQSQEYIPYRVDFRLPEAGVYCYRFEVETDQGILFCGVGADHKTVSGNFLPEWQLTVYDPDFRVPEWVGEGVMYQIFPDRFAKAGADRPFEKQGVLHEDWYEDPVTRDAEGNYYADDFFGGNIAGIIVKLPYLKSLGVRLIYLNPIFRSASNHRYDTGDYTEIDPLFGTLTQFRTLCALAHENGMRIMLDGVFSHTGADSVYFNKFGTYESLGAYQSKHSPYYPWYTFTRYPDEYECWWGVTVVPNVKELTPSYLEFITGEGGIVQRWLEAGADGWRLDVADELPDEFLFALRRRAKSCREDAFILGEVWENASNKESYGKLRPYLLGGQLDSVMNYPFKKGILAYVKDGNAAALNDAIWDVLETYPPQSVRALMNIVGTHDTPRIRTELGGDIALVKIAAAILFLLPGMPCIYYGDEAGLEGEGDPLNRKCYPWGREDQGLLAHYRMLARVREENAEILSADVRDGGFRVLYMDGPVFAFERRGSSGALILVCNVSGAEVCLPIDGIGAVSVGAKAFKLYKIYA